MNEILKAIRNELINKSDHKTKTSGERFFKEKIKLYGVKTALVSAIARKYYHQINQLPKQQIFRFCEWLWETGYMEESFIACHWSYSLHKTFVRDDFELFEKWLHNYVSNWAVCDTFCNHTIGSFIEMYPDYINRLVAWTTSPNRWVRRASAVSLIIPAKKGLFLKDIFRISDLLMEDRDDLVRKGYGWLLKAASEKHQPEIFEYVMMKKSVMPRTALRYAIEKMPPGLKKQAMAKVVK